MHQLVEYKFTWTLVVCGFDSLQLLTLKLYESTLKRKLIELQKQKKKTKRIHTTNNLSDFLQSQKFTFTNAVECL